MYKREHRNNALVLSDKQASTEVSKQTKILCIIVKVDLTGLASGLLDSSASPVSSFSSSPPLLLSSSSLSSRFFLSSSLLTSSSSPPLSSSLAAVFLPLSGCGAVFRAAHWRGKGTAGPLTAGARYGTPAHHMAHISQTLHRTPHIRQIQIHTALHSRMNHLNTSPYTLDHPNIPHHTPNTSTKPSTRLNHVKTSP